MSIKRLVPLFGVLLLAFGQTVPAAQRVTPSVPGASGMPTQSWFMESSNDLSNDLAAAAKRGRILAIVWEQLGCYYCKLMHEVNFQDHDVVNYVRGRFDFVQLDMRGDRVVMDLGGRATTEAMLARANRVTGTPTVQFLDRDGKEVFRMPGYAKPPLFLAIFEYVADKAYKSMTLRQYVVAKIADAKASLKQTN